MTALECSFNMSSDKVLHDPFDEVIAFESNESLRMLQGEYKSRFLKKNEKSDIFI